MRIVSPITGKSYDDASVVFFTNLPQCTAYIKAGAYPLDIMVGNSNKLIFVFSREDHEKLKEKWSHHEL